MDRTCSLSSTQRMVLRGRIADGSPCRCAAILRAVQKVVDNLKPCQMQVWISGRARVCAPLRHVKSRSSARALAATAVRLRVLTQAGSYPVLARTRRCVAYVAPVEAGVGRKAKLFCPLPVGSGAPEVLCVKTMRNWAAGLRKHRRPGRTGCAKQKVRRSGRVAEDVVVLYSNCG